LQIVRLDTSLGRRALIKKMLEDPPAYPDGALVLANDHAEFDGLAVGIHWASSGKVKNIADLLE